MLRIASCHHGQACGGSIAADRYNIPEHVALAYVHMHDRHSCEIPCSVIQWRVPVHDLPHSWLIYMATFLPTYLLLVHIQLRLSWHSSTCSHLHNLRVEVAALMSFLGAALMQDQARSFQSRGLRADYLSSSRSASEQEAILKRLQANKLGLQLLLTTPESFGTDRQYPTLLSALVMGEALVCESMSSSCKI